MANKSWINPAVLLLTLTMTLTSCVFSEKNAGSDFIPDEHILKIKQAVLYPEFVNNHPDSVQSMSYSSLIFGSLTNEEYGSINIGSVGQIIPSTDTLDLGDNPKLINAFINFKVDSTLFLDPSQEGIAQNVYLLRLNTKLDSIHLFNNSITLDDFDPTPISKGQPVFFGGDSIKIYLADSFAEELMAITEKEVDSVQLFVDRIPGMGIVTDPTDGTPGGRLNYMPVQNAYITLNYTMNDADRKIVDTDTTAFFYYSYNYCLNFYESTSGERLGDQTPKDQLYFESFNGVKPYYSAQAAKAMISEWINSLDLDPSMCIALSRASLDFHYQVPADYEAFKHFPGSLTVSYRESSADSTQYFYPLPEINQNVNIGARNPSLRKYTCDVTTYIQDLIEKPAEELTENDDLWLMPLLISEDRYGNTYFTCNPTIYRFVCLEGATSDLRPTLTLTYALVHK